MLPFGVVEPRVDTVAPLLALGQMLEEEAAGDAPAVGAAADAEADDAGDLLRLEEIALRRPGDRIAVERDDALVALARRRLVEGDGQIALVEQGTERRIPAQRREPAGIVLHIAAQRAALVVAHQQADDPALRLRLDRELAVHVLERRAEQRGERQRLGEQRLDRRRIGVRREDLVEHRPQPHDPPARVGRGDREA